MELKTFDKNGWAEKTLPSTEEGILLECECGQWEYFTLEEIAKSQSQEKYYFCDCDRQRLIYAKIINKGG